MIRGGKSSVSIPIDVTLRAQQASIKAMRKTLEEQLSEVDVNSTIGTKLLKTFSQLDRQIDKMDSIFDLGSLNMRDLGRLETAFMRINEIYTQMQSNLLRAPLVDLGIDKTQIKELQEIDSLMTNLRQQKEARRTTKARGLLSELGQTELLQEAETINKASSELTLEGMHETLAKEASKMQQVYTKLGKERQKLNNTLAESRAKEESALQDEATARLKVSQINQQIAAKEAYGKYGTRGISGATTHASATQNFIQMFTDLYNKNSVKDLFAQDSLTQALLDTNELFSDEQKAQLRLAGDQAVARFGEMLVSALSTEDPKIQETFRNVVSSWYTETGTKPMWMKELTSRQAKANEVYSGALIASTAATEIRQNASQAVADKDEEISKAYTQWQYLDGVVSRLHTVLKNFVASLDKDYGEQYDVLLKQQQEARKQTIKNVAPAAFAGSPAQLSSVRNQRDQIDNQLEAKAFKEQLQAGVKQWMSAREIVNYIKQGVRQAYQDIQGLDKAMTEIAVVTDMNISELWGTIDQYMSIAKQYGVTTQGVYEVSALYYQQGLNQADVMDATSETLKLARIAGMGYSDAADAMTVAVRGFSMEMEDASRVTDVYSKVAAASASDSQELAEAMSKTASSAASVGSGFEETTAMIATMVESTREAPQNIGSAIKSVISRFGELKSGNIFDEDGELIDYNKVDSALKSVGISLKDSQGQFREFDEVIEELMEAWDGLDSVSKRYIATQFAGNRLCKNQLLAVSQTA